LLKGKAIPLVPPVGHFLQQNKNGVEGHTMRNRVALGIVAAVLGAWVILPDPLPIVIDDIIAGIALGATLLKLIVSYLRKEGAA
jgi:hypothetical protein